MKLSQILLEWSKDVYFRTVYNTIIYMYKNVIVTPLVCILTKLIKNNNT